MYKGELSGMSSSRRISDLRRKTYEQIRTEVLLKRAKHAGNASSECIWTVQRAQLTEKLTRMEFIRQRSWRMQSAYVKSFGYINDDDGMHRSFIEIKERTKKQAGDLVCSL